MKRNKWYLLAYVCCILLEAIGLFFADLLAGFLGLVFSWISLFLGFFYFSEQYKAHFNLFYPDEYQNLLREKDWRKQFYFQPADFRDPRLEYLQKEILFLIPFSKIGIIIPIAIPILMLTLYSIIYTK